MVAAGYSQARLLTRQHSKSFFFSSLALFGARRRAAFALYAFCRRLDDLVDGDAQSSVLTLSDRLTLAREAVSSIYQGSGFSQLPALPWREEEFAAFRDTVERFRIPQQPFQELINGMEMDLTQTRYATFNELELYCYRAAGVVGLMMTCILGFDDEVCLPFAVDLGIAMQLTNVLRDVKEDWQRGRLYLPLDELNAFGLSEHDVARFCNLAGPREPKQWAAWRDFMAFQIRRARAFDRRSQLGVPHLSGFGSKTVVRLMSAVYGGILRAIERQHDDVFVRRAHVPLLGKLGIAAGVLVSA